jgi:CPA2 family monovalent cation:H+ antiporter-2
VGHADILLAIGGAFLAAALLARLGGRIGLPTIPLFILAGILLGPHTPGLVIVDDASDLEMLSALGLVLLLFYLGLEFHLDDLKRGGARLLAAGGIYLLLNIGAGLGFGFALGWGGREALVLAGVIGISSSAIVTKILIDQGRIKRPETRLILGIIVVEDLFLALYLAALQPVLSPSHSPADMIVQAAKAFGFLLALAAVARYGSRVAGRLIAVRDNELLVVSFLGAAVLIAGVSELLGVTDAIGAFMAGLILSGTQLAPRIRNLVHPLRDAFAAIFFFTFGLAIDPGDVISVLGPVAVAAGITVFVNVIAGLIAARWHRYGPGPAANIATTLVARGEFALILAAIATAAGLDRRLAPFIAGYVLVLAVLGPIMAGRAHWLAPALQAAEQMLPARQATRAPATAPHAAGPHQHSTHDSHASPSGDTPAPTADPGQPPRPTAVPAMPPSPPPASIGKHGNIQNEHSGRFGQGGG